MNGLDEDIARAWSSYARPHIELMPALVNQEVELGVSKFGGAPDLPKNQAWPVRMPYKWHPKHKTYSEKFASEEGELSFIAQINLEEIAQFESDLSLPKRGLLSFFYDVDIQPWGFDPSDSCGWKVIYTENLSLLERKAPRAIKLSPEGPVKPGQAYGMPDHTWMRDKLIELGVSVDRMHKNFDCLEKDDVLYSLASQGHSLGGWASTVQDVMEEECQLASNGIYVGDIEGYKLGRQQGLSGGAGDWRLLLQVESDEALEWMWGDTGTLFFWCRKDDIVSRSFGKVWTILQCG